MIEIRFESDDFVLVLFRDRQAPLGKGGHDALERILAADWAVYLRYMWVVEELMQYERQWSRSCRLGTRTVSWDLGESKGKEKGGHTAAFPHRSTTSPLTP